MAKDVSKNPFAMFFRKITGMDLTANNEVPMQGRFPSSENRNHTLDTFMGDQSAYFGNNNEYDFFAGIESDPLPQIESDVSQFNSRLNLTYDLPSTKRVNRFNAQNKG